MDSTEYEKVFFSKSNPKYSAKQRVEISKENALNLYVYVLYHRGQPIQTVPLPKRGNADVTFGSKVKFCFDASVLSKNELKIIQLSEEIKFRYDLRNSDFLCSNNFKLFTISNDNEISLNDPFYPFLRSRIYKLKALNHKAIEPIEDERINDIVFPVKKIESESNNSEMDTIKLPTEKPSWPIKQE